MLECSNPLTSAKFLLVRDATNDQMELIEGQPFVAPSPSTFHQSIVLRIARAFNRMLEHDGLDEAVAGPPSIVVEVLAQSTSQRDLTIKRNTYAVHGVNEYWIANPTGKTVIVHTDQAEGHDRSVVISRDIATSVSSPAVTFDVRESLFPISPLRQRGANRATFLRYHCISYEAGAHFSANRHE